MRIMNNIMALNAHRQLSVNQSAASKAMEKLSSGLRINRAGDDAAGLAISEKMRGQIRGLKQAMRNAQDGISLIQTAEGALNEIHAILQRMRELATQASTDTYTLTDRKEIQKEINQLLDEIDRIGNNTEFNTQNLLDGSYKNKKIHIGANEGQSMDITISDMRTEALGVDGATGAGGGGTATKATATLSGITFTAVADGAAGNGIQIAFVRPTEQQGEISIEVDPVNRKITVTLATEEGEEGEEGSITTTVDELVQALSKDGAVTALVTVSGSGASFVTAGTATLAGGADASGGASGNIDSLKVGNVDEIDEDDLAGLKNPGVLTQAGADAAITNINYAIEQVSAERSKLGAIQNRLEHTIANLGTSAENLQAAESRIRDVDMAEEMMAFTKYQILQQASIAMLAQANMAPQSVLQLLG